MRCTASLKLGGGRKLDTDESTLDMFDSPLYGDNLRSASPRLAGNLGRRRGSGQLSPGWLCGAQQLSHLAKTCEHSFQFSQGLGDRMLVTLDRVSVVECQFEHSLQQGKRLCHIV
jgi:hypothetical protein